MNGKNHWINNARQMLMNADELLNKASEIEGESVEILEQIDENVWRAWELCLDLSTEIGKRIAKIRYGEAMKGL